MAIQETCQVKGCEWCVLLCPSLCAPHWWKLPKDVRDPITRASIAGMKSANHPNLTYQSLVTKAIALLDSQQGTLAKYEAEPGDRSTHHVLLTYCAQCNTQNTHYGVVRAFKGYLVCSGCQSMVPTIPEGSTELPGMEAEL